MKREIRAISISEMTTGERIKYFRRNAGISQEALASELLITKQTVSRYEHDEIDMKVSVLELIAMALGVSIKTLLCGDEKEEGILPEGRVKRDNSVDEIRLHELFRKLSTRDRRVVLRQIEAFF